MKHKNKICLLLVVVMALGMFSGCSADKNTLGSMTQNTTAATVLSAEEDARLKEDLQKDIDDILNTETEIVHSDTYIPGETYTGTAYYVSNDGDDNNDGLTPETAWQSAEKVGKESMEGGILQFGDAVFFRRGDIFRSFDYDPGTNPFTCRIDGITYSAYGEGAKPIITSSPENGAGAEKWRLVYERENGIKIWQFYQDLMDVAMIVCNDEVIAERIYEYALCNGDNPDDCYYESCTLDYWWMNEEGGVTLLGELLPLEETLTEDLSFVSRPECIDDTDYIFAHKPGPLYLRCDAGNPGELYEDIEFSTFEIFGLISLEANDIVFDNLSLKYTGISFIKNSLSWKAYQNTVIQNCEFAYGGGSVAHYNIWDGNPVIEAQGDGIYCVVRNATIRNNYMHDTICSSISFEDSNPDYPLPEDDYGYCHIIDNIFVNTLGLNCDSTARDSSDALMHLNSLILRNNQVWRTGNLANDKSVYPCGALILPANYFNECIVEDNLFYGMENGYSNSNGILSMEWYETDQGYTKPQLKNNIYAQYDGGQFATFVFHGFETWNINDDDVAKKTADLLGDTTSKFYIIPTE